MSTFRAIARAFALALFAAGASACASAPPALLGAYRLPDGDLLSVRPSDGGLRTRTFSSGESHKLRHERADRWVAGPGFSDAEPVELVVDFRREPGGESSGLVARNAGGEPVAAQREPLKERTLRFRSKDVWLHGVLTTPPGPGPHPALVLVHGSGDAPGTRYFYNVDFLAANGLAVLVYDKRGTGSSQGRYSFDFDQLADDVVAAVEWLAQQPEVDAERIGLAGYSQGGWIAPLAASRSELVRFALVSYGMIDSPAEEERIETRNRLEQRGVSPEGLDQADELTRAAVHIMAKRFRSGWDEFDAIAERYREAAWMDQLDGTTIGAFLKYPHWLVRLVGPRIAPNDLPWYHDSTEVLAALDIPMVWFIAEQDSSAPNAFTLAELARLRERGKPYETVVFPDTDHGIVEFVQAGERRLPTRYAPGYFAAEVEWARRLAGLDGSGADP